MFQLSAPTSTAKRAGDAKTISKRGRVSGGIFGRALAVLACVICASAAPLHAKRQHQESWYADALAEQLAARTEVRLRNGTRCDVFAPHHSIEVAFADQWAEAIGQSLNYASQTGRLPAVALILERSSDDRFLTRLRQVISWHQLPIAVIVLRPFNADALTIEYPAGIVGRPASPTREPINFSRPVAAMNWIPRVRGSFAFEISTPTPNSKRP